MDPPSVRTRRRGRSARNWGPEHQEAHQPTGGGRVPLRPRPGTHPPPGSQEHQTDYHDECDDL